MDSFVCRSLVKALGKKAELNVKQLVNSHTSEPYDFL